MIAARPRLRSRPPRLRSLSDSAGSRLPLRRELSRFPRKKKSKGLPRRLLPESKSAPPVDDVDPIRVERDRLREALSAVTGWHSTVEGGQVQGPSAIPVYRLQGKARGLAQARLDLCNQILDEPAQPWPVKSMTYAPPQLPKLPLP